MPYGIETRSTFAPSAVTFDWGGVQGRYTPLKKFEMVYTYRSEKAKRPGFDTSNSYSRYVNQGGNLHEKMLRRKQYLESVIRDTLEPAVGNTKVFSRTDQGHAFARIKFEADVAPTGCEVISKSTGRLYRASHIHVAALGDMISPLTTGGDVAVSGRASNGLFVWPNNFFTNGSSLPAGAQVAPSSVRLAMGTKLISSTNPWSAKADLAATLFELLNGDVPRLVLNLKRNLLTLTDLRKTAGDEFLNLEFGWAPLIRDIVAAVNTAGMLHDLIYGSSSRRRKREGDYGRLYSFAEQTPNAAGRNISPDGTVLASHAYSTTSPFHQNAYFSDGQGITGAISGSTFRYTQSTIVHADYRFNAKFHQGVTVDDNPRWGNYLQRSAELMGLKMTPAVLWEITPWSWLIDWFTSLGDVVKNLSSLDQLNVLLDYAYLTTRVRSEMSVIVENLSISPTGYTVVRQPNQWISRRVVVDELVREQASPFGFSANWNSLSAYQLSILAALGMTRGR